jgi:superfamily II DNA or RNA helicase
MNRLKIGSQVPIFTDFKVNLRDYQQEALEIALKSGHGVSIMGTGAGKTFTTAALIENFFRNSTNTTTFKCIVLVPTLDLVKQTYDEFIDLGISFTCTKWTGKEQPDLTANVVVANYAIFQTQFEKNEWVNYVDLLIVDECHKVLSNNLISKLITKIHTYNKYGFTGTLPTDLYEQWGIIGKLGPILYTKSSSELRDRNYLTSVEVKVLELNYPTVKLPNYRAELEFLYENPCRNEFIAKLCMKLTNNTLILVNHIAHGEQLYEYMCKTADLHNKQVVFIQGSVDVDVRDSIKRQMEVDSNIICIAISAIFSTGVNIKNLHNIIFAAGGKSFIRTVQSIGRGLRLHKNKDKLIIIDLEDNLKYGKAHGLARKNIYQVEKIPFSTRCINL